MARPVNLTRNLTREIKRLLDTEEKRLDEYINSGGSDTSYLEGKVAGIQECLTRLHEASKLPDIRVSAEISTDDLKRRAKFNCVEWFTSATDKQITALAKCGWGGDYDADDVAWASTTKRVAKILAYCERTGMGFECHVDPEEALTYLKTNRPELWATIIAIVVRRTKRENNEP